MSHGSPAILVFGRRANDYIDWKVREAKRERILRTKESSFKESQQSNTSIFFPFKIPFSISLSLSLLCEESVCGGLPSFLPAACPRSWESQRKITIPDLQFSIWSSLQLIASGISFVFSECGTLRLWIFIWVVLILLIFSATKRETRKWRKILGLWDAGLTNMGMEIASWSWGFNFRG